MLMGRLQKGIGTKMEIDKIKWNLKHVEQPYPDVPSPVLEAHINLAKKGRALDIACGTGRHSKFMRDCGFKVDALDFSDEALKTLEGERDIETIEADLDFYVPKKEHYELINHVHFLQRRLFPYIKESLKSGGILVFETFIESEDTPLKSFSNRDHLLRRNELLHAFISMEVLYYTEKKIVKFNNEEAYLASLVAKKI